MVELFSSLHSFQPTLTRKVVVKRPDAKFQSILDKKVREMSTGMTSEGKHKWVADRGVTAL